MDKELYEALQKAYERRHGRLSVLSPKSESDEDRKAFDRWVSALYKLRDLGFVKFRDNGQVIKNNEGTNYQYDNIACEFTYDAEKALSHGSYEAYVKSLPVQKPLAVNIDQRFQNYGNLSGSNIAVHSQHVNQTVDKASEIEKLFQQIIDALQHDKTLAETQRQELIEDVQSLKAELQRAKPRAGILTELWSALGNTASIASYSPQLWEHVKTFLS
ncbi:MAG: hypothetical protein IPN66_07110 [Candidatus Competibacteraceae bacterium]|nr:hypothetical protein [Candidatus Competibacteraceae bacterium]MBK8896985.1 hypothetical protein [Candidatus Competibacteraceae bacterium]